MTSSSSRLSPGLSPGLSPSHGAGFGPGRPAAALVAALAAVGVLAGCSSSGGTSPAAGRPAAASASASGPSGSGTSAGGSAGPVSGSPAPAGGSAAPVAPAGDDPRYTARLPIAAYSFTDAQTASVDAAVDVLTDRCMRRYGMRYQAPAEPPPPARQSADRRYGLSSAFDAAHYGYHLTPDEESPSTPAPAARGGTAQYLVLFGRPDGTHPDATGPVTYQGRAVPLGGCRGEARATLDRDDDPAAARAAAAIADDSYGASGKDPAVRKATQAWSACMRGKGYAYPTPLAALGDKSFIGRPVSPREVATAEADMACKRTTGLLGTWFAAETRVQDAMIARQRAELGALRSAHAAKLAAAARIVAAG